MARAMVARRIRIEGVTHPVPDYRVVEGEPRDCPHSPPRGRILGELRDDGFGYWAAETRRDPAALDPSLHGHLRRHARSRTEDDHGPSLSRS